MSTIRLHVAPPLRVSMPRGSRYAAAVFVALWRVLAALGRNAPPLPKTPEEEAQAVRELAFEYRQRDPRFAAELVAAADRHERLHGVS